MRAALPWKYRHCTLPLRQSPLISPNERLLVLTTAVALSGRQAKCDYACGRLLGSYIPFADALCSTLINGCAEGGMGVWLSRTI